MLRLVSTVLSGLAMPVLSKVAVSARLAGEPRSAVQLSGLVQLVFVAESEPSQMYAVARASRVGARVATAAATAAVNTTFFRVNRTFSLLSGIRSVTKPTAPQSH